jgi:ABC-type uncharacterized transport system involved in gliding motility auxiliary subunit/ABC-type transport system involved in multi-copper enzyme maturation permease subunit
MKNIIVITQRELRSLFTSPIGYIFMMVFLAVSIGLYMTSFFTFPVADMQQYFGNLPIILCVFIPAITMRVWAEERKENTWELLLTFPMRASELVLGKFLAMMIFFAITLAGTLTVPLMLAVLGDPDMGAITAAYLGTLLLGALFLSIGIFFSGFFKDQIVAFVTTLLVCFALFLVGTNFFASSIDGMFGESSMFAGLGSIVSELLGVIDHYSAFTRGVVELSDVAYFVAWTVAFLYLNILYVGERHRPGARLNYTIIMTLCAVIGLTLNWLLGSMSLGRFDFTEDKIHTVSTASKAILARMDDNVQVKLYISRKDTMPSSLKNLEHDIRARLEEIEAASNSKVTFGTVYLEPANYLEATKIQTETGPFGNPILDPADEEKDKEEEKTREKIIEERMQEKGIEPFPYQTIANDQVTSKLIYSHIGIEYKDKAAEIIPFIVPQALPDLEYQLVSTIYKLTLDRKPIVALVAAMDGLTPEQMAIYRQFNQPVPPPRDNYGGITQILTGEDYDVRRIELTKESPLPAEFDVLVVVNPRNFNDRQLWEINRAVVEGKSVFLAVQNYEWQYSMREGQLMMVPQAQNSGINTVLSKYGMSIEEGFLMSDAHRSIGFPSGNPIQDALGGLPVDSTTHMLLGHDSMVEDTSITGRLSSVLYLWGAALSPDEETLKTHGLESTTLMTSNETAWKSPFDQETLGARMQGPDGSEQRAYPVMAMVSGQFPDAFEGTSRPAWPLPPPPMPGQPPAPPTPEEGPEVAAVKAPGKLIVVGGGHMFQDRFLQRGGVIGNLDLFMNSVDAMALSDDIASVRGRKAISRVIDRPTDMERFIWRLVNFGAVNLLIALAGISMAVSRVLGRNAYTASHQANGGA